MQTTKNVKVMQQRGPMPPKLFKCHNRPINVLRQPAQPHFILTSMKSRKPSHPNPLLPPMPPICDFNFHPDGTLTNATSVHYMS